MKFKSRVNVELGKYSYRMVVYVAEIGENWGRFSFANGNRRRFLDPLSLNLYKKRNQSTFSVVELLLLRKKFRMGVGNSSSEILRKWMSLKRVFLQIFLRNSRIYFLNKSLLKIAIICSMKLNCRILALLNKLSEKFLLVSERK